MSSAISGRCHRTRDRKLQSLERYKINDFYLQRKRLNILMPEASLFSLSSSRTRNVPMQPETWLPEIVLLLSLFPQISFLLPKRQGECISAPWRINEWMNEWSSDIQNKETFANCNLKSCLSSKRVHAYGQGTNQDLWDLKFKHFGGLSLRKGDSCTAHGTILNILK